MYVIIPNMSFTDKHSTTNTHDNIVGMLKLFNKYGSSEKMKEMRDLFGKIREEVDDNILDQSKKRPLTNEEIEYLRSNRSSKRLKTMPNQLIETPVIQVTQVIQEELSPKVTEIVEKKDFGYNSISLPNTTLPTISSKLLIEDKNDEFADIDSSDEKEQEQEKDSIPFKFGGITTIEDKLSTLNLIDNLD